MASLPPDARPLAFVDLEATGASPVRDRITEIGIVDVAEEKVQAGKPCFAHQLHKCKGACIGREKPAAHTVRLVQALVKLQLKAWPFAGPALLKEGDHVLVIDHWCYLGTAKSEDELWELPDSGRPQFDRDTYRILSKVANRLVPL